jgi:hypothetical protein
MFLRTSK